MVSYIIVALVSGILFGAMDVLINGNPFAKKLYKAYSSISRTSVNIPAGIIIDLVYGFVLTGLFLLIYQNLPGNIGIIKGISFAVIIWFLRVAMYAASHWMMFNIPVKSLLYTLITGFWEMCILGILYGLTLQP